MRRVGSRGISRWQGVLLGTARGMARLHASVPKPLLRYLTTIDFGQLTYEHELQALLDTAEGLT